MMASLKLHAKHARESMVNKKSPVPKYILTADGSIRVIWDLVNVVMLLYTCFEIPFSVVFVDSNCDWTWLSILNITIDCLFLVDIIITFFTAYDDDLGAQVTDHKLIAKKYLLGWFTPDIVSSVPVDKLACLAASLDTSQSNLLRLLKIVRFMKMARLFKILRMFKKWETISGSSGVSTILRLSKFVCFMIFVSHLSGCCWVLVVQLNDCWIYVGDAVHDGASKQSDLNVVCDCNYLVEPEGTCVEWNWMIKFDRELWYDDTRIGTKYLTSLYFTIVTLATVRSLTLLN